MSEHPCRCLNEEIISSGFIHSFDNVLTDCDGVLWKGNDVLPGARETVKYFKDHGKKVIYVTNNSTKSRKDYLKKFQALGFDAKLDEIISSAYCTALYLKSLNFKRKVYVISMGGVSDELQEIGIEWLSSGLNVMPHDWITWMKSISVDPEVGAVVVGFDVYFNYAKIALAATYLNQPGCIYIATNTDEQFPSEGNKILPGTGSFVSAVSCVAGRQPIVMGKPSEYMFECIKMVHPELKPERCLMIGDRLSTDIAFGRKLSMQTLFVLTGVHTLEDVRESMNSTNLDKLLEIPDYYAPSLNDVANLLQSNTSSSS